MALDLPTTPNGRSLVASTNDVFFSLGNGYSKVTAIYGRGGWTEFVPGSDNRWGFCHASDGIFIGAMTGTGATAPHIVATTDMGRSWSYAAPFAAVEAGISFVFTSVGRLFCRTGFNLYYASSVSGPWTATDCSLDGLAKIGSRLVGNHSSGSYAAYSDDNGATWVQTGIIYVGSGSSAFDSIAASESSVAMSKAGVSVNYIAYSTDAGVSWLQASGTPSDYPIRKLVYGAGLYIALLADGTYANGGISYSVDDGKSWSAFIPLAAVPKDIAFGAGIFIDPDGQVLNNYLPQPWYSMQFGNTYTPVATDSPTPKTLGALSRRCVPKLGAGKLAHQKMFGAPRGLYASSQSIIQTGGADPTANRNILLDPSSGLPLAVGTDGNLVAVSDSGGVWLSS